MDNLKRIPSSSQDLLVSRFSSRLPRLLGARGILGGLPVPPLLRALCVRRCVTTTTLRTQRQDLAQLLLLMWRALPAKLNSYQRVTQRSATSCHFFPPFHLIVCTVYTIAKLNRHDHCIFIPLPHDVLTLFQSSSTALLFFTSTSLLSTSINANLLMRNV